MFDLTGVALVSYMQRVIRNTVIRNPRFRRSLGDVSLVSGNRISFGNVQILVGDVSTDGSRQFLDNFISTLTGRAILAQIPNKDGLFIEWVTETDATGQTPAAGVYYLNVDAVNEATGDVDLTMESFAWYQGSIRNAQGSKITFSPAIDVATVQLTDGATGDALEAQTGPNCLWLLSPATTVVAKVSGTPLTPLTDYWVERQSSQVILPSTIFGQQTAQIPTTFSNVSIVDQDGYTLRSGSDYIYMSATEIVMAAWTPSGQTISAVGTVKLDPTIAGNAIHPENTLSFTVPSGDALASGQAAISTQDADGITVVPAPNGTVTLPAPLPPGGWCTYDVRLLLGSSQVSAKKNAVNKGILPGLRIAIGDQVVEDDQCAIIVSPCVTETYRVYGGKPNVSFSLEVKANDPTTVDELGKMLKQELLWKQADNLAADGLTIYDISVSPPAGGQRDQSGTSPTYALAMQVSGAADWRIFEPLVTRVLNFEINVTPGVSAFFGAPRPATRYSFVRASGFIPDYR